jgi:NAD(P)-dependent dehydrogenase (short-subunit alcohol dehydrogenase family)
MTVLDSFSLKGKTALVTGGSGLYGRQIVRALAEAGAKTFAASRGLEALRADAARLAADGLDVTALRLDLGDERSILDLRDEIVKRAGGLEVLVNNAVLRPMKKGFGDESSAFAESMKVNATGLFLITRAMGDVMAARGGGSIINIGSIHGMIGPDPPIYEGTEMHGFYPDYFFHKGGMLNFSRFTASYYGAKGVRCNCVSPGGFRTETMPAAFVGNYSRRTFLGRLAGDTDLMGVVVFLAADASSYITGANIAVDGGYTAK